MKRNLVLLIVLFCVGLFAEQKEYKLQKLSRGYYIAVPKVVVRSWNLDAGSHLVWVFESGRLILAPTCEKNYTA